MWSDRLRFAERVVGDLGLLSASEREALPVALERLDDDPIAGVPLYEPFRGYWSYRVGTVRIVYRLSPEARIVLVAKIESVPGGA